MIRLEPRSAAILAQLQAANGAVVTRHELLDRCWEPGGGSDEALTQAVAQVRRAFEQLQVASPIETLAKRGYRLHVRFKDQPRTSGPGRHKPFGGWLIISGLMIVAVVAISVSHPVRHAVRHALGLGQPDRAAQHSR